MLPETQCQVLGRKLGGVEKGADTWGGIERGATTPSLGKHSSFLKSTWTCVQMFTATLSVKAEIAQMSIRWQTGHQDEVQPYQGLWFSYKKDRNTVTHVKTYTEKPWKHDATWKKPDTQKITHCAIPFIWKGQNWQTKDAGSRWVVIGGGGKGDRGWLPIGKRFWGAKNNLELVMIVAWLCGHMNHSWIAYLEGMSLNHFNS